MIFITLIKICDSVKFIILKFEDDKSTIQCSHEKHLYSFVYIGQITSELERIKKITQRNKEETQRVTKKEGGLKIRLIHISKMISNWKEFFA